MNVRVRTLALLIGTLGSIAGLLAIAWLEDHHSLRGRIGLPLAPEELVDRGRTVLLDMGLFTEYPDDYVPSEDARVDHHAGQRWFNGRLGPARDVTANGFRYDLEALRFAVTAAESRDAGLEIPSDDSRLIEFWHRESEVRFKPSPESNLGSPSLRPVRTGHAEFVLSTEGLLKELEWIPPQYEGPNLRLSVTGSYINSGEPTIDHGESEGPQPGWDYFFGRAGLELEGFTESTPVWNPRNDCNEQFAWDPPEPVATADWVRVEACEFAGRASYFEVIPVWRQPARDPEGDFSRSRGPDRDPLWRWVAWLVVLAAGVASVRVKGYEVAWRSTLGAVCSIAIISFLGGWMRPVASTSSGITTFQRMEWIAGSALIDALVIGVLCVLTEPMIRVAWPRATASWRRLTTARALDPTVGRSLVLGTVLGVLVVFAGRLPAMQATDWPPLTALPTGSPVVSLSHLLLGGSSAVVRAFEVVLVIALLRAMLRRSWLACLVAIPLIAWVTMSVGETGAVERWYWPLLAGALALSAFSGGLLGVSVTLLVVLVAPSIPVSLRVDSWYGAEAIAGILCISLIAVYGFVASCTPRRADRSPDPREPEVP